MGSTVALAAAATSAPNGPKSGVGTGVSVSVGVMVLVIVKLGISVYVDESVRVGGISVSPGVKVKVLVGGIAVSDGVTVSAGVVAIKAASVACTSVEVADGSTTMVFVAAGRDINVGTLMVSVGWQAASAKMSIGVRKIRAFMMRSIANSE